MDFPISPLLPAIRDSLATHPRLVLEAPPGAGKTTQVPLALLEAPWLQGRRILMLEPRRIAARSAAAFMARQLGEEAGGTVGYRIRFESRVSARTRIEVVTEGILTRLIQDDPLLEGVGALLFDEFHERHLSADLGLALALDVQAQLREDLRLVVMSATLDGERLARFLDAPRLSSEGRSFPVETSHFPARRDESLEAQARRAIEQALAQHPGDVLVFLPGQREIARVGAALDAASLPAGVEVLALHGELPVEQQSKVLQPAPDGRRRVVLATNVAESSVTLPGVRVVIDSGLAREPRFDPVSGFSRLDAVPISQASADQRAGRAGRVAPGVAWRLWPQSQRLEAQRRPEMAQVELAGLALELAAWGSDALRFVDPPPPGALASARELLQRLGALDGGAITALGRRMLELGTHPRLAAMLSAAPDDRARALAADLAALLEARDPLRSRSDALAERWRALAAFRGGRMPADASRSALAAIDAAARQWRRRLRCEAAPPAQIEAHELGDLLAHAFPDRIAARHPADPLRYQLANGRMARLFEDSAVRGEPWLVATELRFEPRGDALLLRAAPVDEARLRADFPDRFVEEEGAVWDAQRRALVARRESRFDRIVLDSRPAGRVDPAHAAQALANAVRELGLESLPWTEGLRQWQARVACLRSWMPELGLPDVTDDALLASVDAWLRPAFAGKTRLDALTEQELGEALKSPLDWNLRQQVDRLAPVRIAVPSGMARPVESALEPDGSPRPPVLAVKLQELFGLADTPRIADGRVPLLLHLLSPGGKPLQVTGDLRSFWDNTYPEVRKEMKGRYPKHPWPDDPWSATATHRAKPRGT
ncbi:ATP-dependent helicase HrpB [Pseudoxanthomonas suwonensis]|uniref:ATP-dependent helicase HrpB n=1 Tax=Pseudoxanthomonas suwonensis TaxID=314722 RepID=UPI00138F8742|nr:ATP-dependent helicase HrpB [Pseudoxanthomonas suwonensis]KAF1703045.1 ATP-dependent helicase HrpB [Pseudoxanthomonas suwonensis]